ncbi:unnamed protein product [Rotaria sp. Silwood1]|nr:unnamed protein product [Rotaria sp. Silwood1]
MIQWRIDNHVDLILEDQLMMLRMDIIRKMAPSAHHGYTKAGRPLFIEKFGLVQVDKLLNRFTSEELIQCHIYWLECCCQRARERSRQLGKHVENFATIYDLHACKENASGYYRTSRIFLAKILCDLFPMRVIASFIFAIFAYRLTDFQRSINRFLIFFLTIFINSIFGSAVCFFISACIPVFAVVLTAVILCFIMMMALSDFLVDLENINLTFCLSNNTHICPMTGEKVLTERNIPHNTNWDIWKNLLFISIMALVFFIMTYIRLL